MDGGQLSGLQDLRMSPAGKPLRRSPRFGCSLSSRGCVSVLLPQLAQEERNDRVAGGDTKGTGVPGWITGLPRRGGLVT